MTPNDHAEFSRRAKPSRGDVLVSKDGTLGVARVVETDDAFSIFVSVALLQPDRARLDPWFLRYYFESDLFARQLLSRSAGSALRHIHLEDFRESLMVVPPLSAQEELVRGLRLIEGAATAAEARRTRAHHLEQRALSAVMGVT